jgi:phosphatidylserine/phosphatidylglycerophosphate/cardiolipin synthase-like enzyme
MAFDSLAGGALEVLAAALESGALRPPCSAGGLSRWLGPREAEAAAHGLGLFATLAPADLARVLRLLADERRRSSSERTRAELVWSGPDTPGVVSRDTSVVVRRLFQAARHSVLVTSFAVSHGEQVFGVLAERLDADPELTARLVLNVARPHLDTTPEDVLLRRFAAQFFATEWPGEHRPEVYYDPRALAPAGNSRAAQHAKCVVIDDAEAFVTSANFTEAAQERNIEVGVLLRDPEFARTLREHFDALIDSGALRRLPRPRERTARRRLRA